MYDFKNYNKCAYLYIGHRPIINSCLNTIMIRAILKLLNFYHFISDKPCDNGTCNEDHVFIYDK